MSEIEQIEANLLGMMDYSKRRWEELGISSEQESVHAQAYAQCATALQLSRIATALENPGVHPQVPEALNRIATGVEMLERQ